MCARLLIWEFQQEPESRTEPIPCKLKEYCLDKIALSETQVNEPTYEFIIFGRGLHKDQRRKSGVGFVLKN